MRRPKDRDFVETEEGLVFCLIGYLHPPDRYTAYLKYTPSKAGRWKRAMAKLSAPTPFVVRPSPWPSPQWGEGEGTREVIYYQRELEYYHVRNVGKTLEFLKSQYPRYVTFDPLQNLTFSFVPRDAVAIYHYPEKRPREILAAPADPLEKDVEAFVSLLVAAGGPDPGLLGITGSILLKIHDPSFSDIDLLLYGREATARARVALSRSKDGSVQAVDPERLSRWRDETAVRFGLDQDDIARLEGRRWNYLQFRDRYVSLQSHPAGRWDP